MLQQLGMSASADLLNTAPGDGSSFPAAMHTAQRSMRQGSGLLRGTGSLATPSGKSFLSFVACGDWATQRLSLLSGMVLAAELNRTLLLPQLQMGGRIVDFGYVLCMTWTAVEPPCCPMPNMRQQLTAAAATCLTICMFSSLVCTAGRCLM
jgi:hypothetical protein